MNHRNVRAGLCASALTYAIFSAAVLAAGPAVPSPAQVSPPDVGFQVWSVQDVANRGSSLDLIFAITNRSDVALQNLQIVAYPKKSQFDFSPPALNALSPFGSENAEASERVHDDADFQMYHQVFVLQYNWKAGAAQYTSAQTTTLNLQVNRQFEDEAKGLPGGTASLLYLILPIMILFLAYGITESFRHGNFKIPEFKSEYIATAFLLAIVFNVVLIFEWQKDESYLYATPQRFATSVAVLAGMGAAIPFLRWLDGFAFHTFRKTDSAKQYLKKMLRQSKSGQVRWTKATVEGVPWEGVLLQQPSGTKILGSTLQVSPKSGGTLTAEELKKIVDANGKISDRRKLLDYVRRDMVTLAVFKKVKQSDKQVDPLFIEDKAMIVSSDAAQDERIVKFVS